MSQTTQCDTRSPLDCALLTSIKPSVSCTLDTNISHAHGTDVHSPGWTIYVLSLCGPPQEPWPTLQQPRGGCSTCQHCPIHRMRPQSFPFCLPWQLLWVFWELCTAGWAPEEFCLPCSGEGQHRRVNPRAEHSVSDSLICVFASLPACSRARCFSLLE